MGTRRRVSGEIVFDPPLTHADIRNAPGGPLWPFLDSPQLHRRPVRLAIEETTEETDDGVVTRQSASRIVATWDVDGPHAGYYGNRDIDSHLRYLVDLLGPDRVYGGHLEVMADVADVADFEAYRLRVVSFPDRGDPEDGEVRVYRSNAEIVWGEYQ